MVGSLTHISANAVVPDQLLPYVAAVSGLETRIIGDCALHYGDGQGVLVAYPLHDAFDVEAAEAAVRLACELPDLERITVLGAARPLCAPDRAVSAEDAYWQMDLPATGPASKLANILRRARTEVEVVQTAGKDAWTNAHQALAKDFCKAKGSALDAGAIYLFQHLGAYLAGSHDARLFSALRQDGSLAALAIGDFTALGTAFYMFAFRRQDAPPGASDLLLDALSREAEARGHARLNLGLGINPGVEFFKKKWGASRFLPYIETSWELTSQRRKGGWLRRIFGA